MGGPPRVRARDNARALADGLRLRPVAETLADVLDDERRLGLGRDRSAGLSRDDEPGAARRASRGHRYQAERARLLLCGCRAPRPPGGPAGQGRDTTMGFFVRDLYLDSNRFRKRGSPTSSRTTR
nr:hypothetical protein [Angustibacter aerolatus]